MKKLLSLICLGLILSSFVSNFPHVLAGRWKMKFKDGNDVTAVFRKDGTHDFFINKKLFVSGKHQFSNDTLRAMDPICKLDYYATYTIEFMNADSIRFRALEDSCPPRKQDMDGSILVRIK